MVHGFIVVQIGFQLGVNALAFLLRVLDQMELGKQPEEKLISLEVKVRLTENKTKAATDAAWDRKPTRARGRKPWIWLSKSRISAESPERIQGQGGLVNQEFPHHHRYRHAGGNPWRERATSCMGWPATPKGVMALKYCPTMVTRKACFQEYW